MDPMNNGLYSCNIYLCEHLYMNVCMDQRKSRQILGPTDIDFVLRCFVGNCKDFSTVTIESRHVPIYVIYMNTIQIVDNNKTDCI